MTARWEELGLLEAYKRDYADRFSTKPHVVRPSALPLEEYADVYVARGAAEYLSAYNEDEPWFCWLSFGGPHEPWDTPEPYASMYNPQDMPEAIPSGDISQERPRGHLDYLLGTHAGAEEYQSSTPSHDQAPNHAPELTPEEIGRMRADYAGNVTLIDDQIGAVLEVISSRGELENTVIVFISDHGEMNGDHGLIYKENFLDPAVRVPLIVRTPSTLSAASSGQSLDVPVEWFDVGPTLVELAGGDLPYRQFARSLVPLLNGGGDAHREDALSQIWGEHMLVTDRWKFVVNPQGQPYMLFDLAQDPQEKDNLAGRSEYKDVETALGMRLLARIAESYLNERN
jgi:choline-sulfatase